MAEFDFCIEEKVLTEYTIEGNTWEEAFKKFKDIGDYLCSSRLEIIDKYYNTAARYSSNFN